MSIGQWTHCIDIMKEYFLRIISWIENILFLVVFSQASLWWRLKPHVASQFQAKQRLRPRDGGRCGLVSFSHSSFILRPGSKLRRASTKGLPFGARKKPPLVMRYKVGAHFLPQFAISARSNICQRETHSCLFSQGFFSSPEENQPTWHYNAHRQTAPPAGWRYLMWLSTLAIWLFDARYLQLIQIFCTSVRGCGFGTL